MNQCSPSQIILSEKRVHVTHTLTCLMLQKTLLPWSALHETSPLIIKDKKEKKGTCTGQAAASSRKMQPLKKKN